MRSFLGVICGLLCKTYKWPTHSDGSNLHLPEFKIGRAKHFIHRTLRVYTGEGSKIIDTNGNKFPLIFTGDFNITFADKNLERLAIFLQQKINLKMNNEESITKYGITMAR